MVDYHILSKYCHACKVTGGGLPHSVQVLPCLHDDSELRLLAAWKQKHKDVASEVLTPPDGDG